MNLWDILPEDLQLKILNEKIDINIKESEKLRQEQEDKIIDEYHNKQLIEDISKEYDAGIEYNYEGYDAGIEYEWESETEYVDKSDTEYEEESETEYEEESDTE
jgi:hypothetical protein